MIENNSEEMKNLVKKVDDYLISNYIFCNKNWLKEKIEPIKSSRKLEEEIMKEIINTDINTFIDKERTKNYLHLSKHTNFSTKLYEFNKFIFIKILGYSNIAEPIENVNKSSDNLDVLDNFESKYLQSEGEEMKKTEKVLLKFELTEGIDKYYGFEYESLNDLRNSLNSASNTKFPKILIGPKTEIRRGIIYMRNNNIKLL
jgi:hypothetical protein